jgi:MFS family permease
VTRFKLLSAASFKDIPAGVWALGFVSMLMDISSEMIHALLPIYMISVLGTPVLAVGVIEGIAEATAALAKIFSGSLSDWRGRRKGLVVLGYGLAAFAKPIFPLAPGIEWLVGARFLDRVGKGIRGAPRDAMLVDLSPTGMRGRCFGLRQSLDTIGAFVGPFVAILLMWWTANNYVFVFWVAVVPAFLALALIILTVHEPERSPNLPPANLPLSLPELKKLSPAYWRIVAVASTSTLARFSEAFLILKAQSVGLPIYLVPAVLVLMNVVYAIAAYPAGILSDRVDRRTLLIIGLGLLIGADLVLAMASSVGAVAVGVILWGLHMGLTQGLLSAMVADTAPTELRGTAFGMFNMFCGIALLAASLVAGALWDQFGPSGTFLAGAGFATLSLVGWSIFDSSDAQQGVS